jgi:CheY-like chemotaxis protein
MAWNEIRHRARLVKEYGPVPPVEGNEARVGQVILNLVINATQAIPEGSVETNLIRVSTSRDDTSGHVVIEIRDSGCGIPPENLPRIFEPFFTTKAIGVGTGLGLSISHRIVSDLGGAIEVESQVGSGTTFRLRLPASSRSDVVIGDPSVAPATASVRSGRLLIIDDEPRIARSIERILGREHNVTIASSARDALERIVTGERFDVILCDLLMPQMTGMELHATLLREVPDQARRIVFLTGGAFTPSARSFLDSVPNQRIEKPFDTTHLRALVNDRIR